jgi:hypothetical protein
MAGITVRSLKNGTGGSGGITIRNSTSVATALFVVNANSILLNPINSVPKIQTNLMTSPDAIFSLARITALSISQTWRGLPSGSLTVKAHKSKEADLLAFFYPSRPISCYGIDFMVGISAIEFSHQMIIITVPLLSFFDSYGDSIRGLLDKPIQINLKPSGLNPITPPTRSYAFNYVANQSGITITGSDPISIPISSTEPDNSETITLKSLIDDISLIQGKYPDYIQSSGLALKDFRNQPIHALYDWEIKELSYDSTGGWGEVFSGIRLAKELNNAELIVDNSVNASDPTNLSGVGYAISIEGDLTPQVPPTINRGFYQEAYPPDYLRNPTHAFDAGGITKTKKTIKTFNGETIEEIEEAYGLVYTSLDIFVINVTSSSPFRYTQQFLNQFIDGYWQQVSYLQKSYSHDGDGNLKGFVSSGWALQRFKQESEQLELLDLRIEELDPATDPARLAIIAQIKSLYTAVSLPISSSQIHHLQRMDSHYADVTDDSKYIKKSFFSQTNTQLIADPESTNEDPAPPITTGVNKTEEQHTTVLAPQSKNSPQTPEKYQIRSFSTDSSGQNFRDSASINQVQIATGRPPTVSKIVRTVPVVQPPPTSTARYLVKTAGALPVLSTDIINESFSFTGGTTYAKVHLGTQTQLSHTNTEQTFTVSITLHNRKDWYAGERVSWSGHTWTILSISDSQEVRADGKVYCTDYVLSLGRFLDVSIVPV